jgi:hypothetical protein
MSKLLITLCKGITSSPNILYLNLVPNYS